MYVLKICTTASFQLILSYIIFQVLKLRNKLLQQKIRNPENKLKSNDLFCHCRGCNFFLGQEEGERKKNKYAV